MRSVVFVLVLTALAPAAAAAPARLKVCTVPLGPYDKRLLAVAERGIEYLYGFEVERLAGRAMPREAYYRPRQRYRAEKILDYLDREVVPGSGCDKIMGFTALDISTTKGAVPDWGILGLSTIGGPAGVMSTRRVRRRVSRRTQAKRTVNVMNHELGHALGLPHHNVPGCIMHDAEGSVRTVDHEDGLLCDESRRAIEARDHLSLPALSEFDWRQVL